VFGNEENIVNNEIIINENNNELDLSSEPTPEESQVLSNLNQILDNNDQNLSEII